MDFFSSLGAVLPIYVMVAVGWGLRGFKVLTAEMEKGMLKLVIHCLYPCLILDKVLGNDLVREGGVLYWGVGLGFGIIVTGMLVSNVVGRVLGLTAGEGRRTFTVAGGVQNFGYAAIPVLTVIAGDERVLGVLFVHSLGVEIALWVVGVIIMTGSARGSLKLLINGPIVAVISGVALSFTGGWRFFDVESGPMVGGVLRQAMEWLGDCAFPIGLILIGATMYELTGKERFSFKVTAGALLVRLLIMPVVILSLAKFLPLALSLKQLLLVQAAMPAGVTPIILARHYGGSPGVAVQVVLGTSLVGLFTMPLWISWGSRYIFG